MEKTENNNLDQNTEEKIDFSGNTEKDNDIGGRSENREIDINKTGETTKNDCAAGSKQSFEELIKGPYKEEFDKRVQRIINKRFKELLSVKEYEVYKLYIKGFSFKDIGNELKIKEKSVDNAVQRIKKKAKEVKWDI